MMWFVMGNHIHKIALDQGKENKRIDEHKEIQLL